MCRLMSCIPSAMPRNDILDLLIDMEGQNTDGTGFGYLSKKGFIIKKTHLSISQILKKKSKWDFFGDCFKHDSHVLFHLRKSSCGPVISKSAHPFLVNDSMIGVHNGSYRNYELIKVILGKNIKYSSGIDSEVALHLLDKIGHAQFNKFNNDNGVYLTINKDGELTAIKNTFQGDLKIAALDEKRDFLISELSHDCGYKNEELDSGFYIFNKEGEMIKSHRKVDETSNYVSNKGYRKSWKDSNSSNSSNISSIPNQAALPGIYQHNSHYNKKPVKLDGNPMVGNFSEEMYHGGPWD